jgi:hypothetical protein
MSIAAAAAKGALAAFDAAGDALTTVRVRLGPTDGAYNPLTDAVTRTWLQDTPNIRALGYDSKSERQEAAMKPSDSGESRLRSFVVLGISITAPDPNQTGEIVEGSTTWQIARVETDPTKAVWIFHCTA